MLVTVLYGDLDFKSHFRLTRNSVEVIKSDLFNNVTCNYYICNILSFFM